MHTYVENHIMTNGRQTEASTFTKHKLTNKRKSYNDKRKTNRSKHLHKATRSQSINWQTKRKILYWQTVANTFTILFWQTEANTFTKHKFANKRTKEKSYNDKRKQSLTLFLPSSHCCWLCYSGHTCPEHANAATKIKHASPYCRLCDSDHTFPSVIMRISKYIKVVEMKNYEVKNYEVCPLSLEIHWLNMQMFTHGVEHIKFTKWGTMKCFSFHSKLNTLAKHANVTHG